MEKMTNVKALTTVIAYAGDNKDAFSAEVVEKLENMKASYEKKSTNRKPTKAQETGAEVRKAVVEVLTGAPAAMTATQVLNAIADRFEGLTLPKVTAQLTALKKDNEIERFLDKKTAYFKIAETAEEVA